MRTGKHISRLVLGVITGLLSYYLTLLPLAVLGVWRNFLIPGLPILTQFLHVWFIVAVWYFTGSKRWLWIAVAFALTALLSFELVFGSRPPAEMYSRLGLTWTLTIWMQITVPTYGASLLTGGLLHKADRIGPRLLKNWRPIYETET